MDVEFDEVRRLTGPSLLWALPGAVLDVVGADVRKAQLPDLWQHHARTVLDAFGWTSSACTAQVFSGGASLAISAPLDALYTACDVAELIWACCDAQLRDQPAYDWQAQFPRLHTALQQERNPQLLSLHEEAERRGVLALSDDDEFSLGAGVGAQTWPLNALPALEHIDWSQHSAIPIAYVTGTNGKSTSVRLAAEIALAAGFQAGLTSTDFIRVGSTILDYGDFSGPGGARTLLRHAQTEIAFLEVARGGILRRGLPVAHVQAALITNVASDHLGQYGIDTVEELASVKFVVAKALDPSGVLVLNADNELVVKQAHIFCETQPVQLCWFSKDPHNAVLAAHKSRGGRVVYLDDSHIVYADTHGEQSVLPLTQIPMTFGGHARHNVENALGVVGLCLALALPLSAIRTGLQRFASDPQDNPGRGNLYNVNGVQVIVDFAHNAHSMQAVVELAKNMPAQRRWVMFGHAGDRSDQDLIDLTDAVTLMQPDHYIVCEYEHYLRGRQLGDIPKVVSAHLLSRGVPSGQITVANEPLAGAKMALTNARAGDVVLLFVLDDRTAVHDYLTHQP